MSSKSSDFPRWPVQTDAANTSGAKRKELWPTVAEYAQWRRDCRYNVSAAAAYLERALKKLQQADSFKGDVLAFPVEDEWETLGAKFGKALRPILEGDFKREVATMEEASARKGQGLLSGWAIYALVNQNFQRDARLAQPLALKELQLVTMGEGKEALRPFMTK